MKILLDECIDRRLAKELIGEHLIKTVPQMGWATIKNGKLLALAETEFDVFVTVDRNLSVQQTLSKFNLAVLVLHAHSNRLADLKPLVPQILRKLPQLEPGKVETVEMSPIEIIN
jgi:predicted nuclease of predicted toxin-antitoxin system